MVSFHTFALVLRAQKKPEKGGSESIEKFFINAIMVIENKYD